MDIAIKDVTLLLFDMLKFLLHFVIEAFDKYKNKQSRFWGCMRERERDILPYFHINIYTTVGVFIACVSDCNCVPI